MRRLILAVAVLGAGAWVLGQFGLWTVLAKRVWPSNAATSADAARREQEILHITKDDLIEVVFSTAVLKAPRSEITSLYTKSGSSYVAPWQKQFSNFSTQRHFLLTGDFENANLRPSQETAPRAYRACVEIMLKNINSEPSRISDPVFKEPIDIDPNLEQLGGPSSNATYRLKGRVTHASGAPILLYSRENDIRVYVSIRRGLQADFVVAPCQSNKLTYQELPQEAARITVEVVDYLRAITKAKD